MKITFYSIREFQKKFQVISKTYDSQDDKEYRSLSIYNSKITEEVLEAFTSLTQAEVYLKLIS